MGCGMGGCGNGGCCGRNNNGCGNNAGCSSGGNCGGGSSAGGRSGSLRMNAGGSYGPEDVDAFLTNCDDRARQAFLGMPQDVQAAVMSRGDLNNCSNPSSALLGRLRDASRGQGRATPY